MKSDHSILETGCKIAGLVRSAESISLDLLRDIDATVENLVSMAKVLTGMAEMLRAVSGQVVRLPVAEGEYIDPEDDAVDGMLRSIEHYKSRLASMVLQRKSIDGDSRLASHHCDALHDAYEAAEMSIAEIIDALMHARAAIIRHDLAAEPRGPSFDSVDSLIQSLRG